MTDLLAPAPYVTVPVAAAVTGYSEKAIRRKIEGGVWLAGREYIKAPDGHILISIKGYAQWAEQGQGSKSGKNPSGSPSRLTESSTAAP